MTSGLSSGRSLLNEYRIPERGAAISGLCRLNAVAALLKTTVAVGALVLGPARGAAAQQSISEVLDFLVTSQSVQTGSVERDRAAAEATRDALSRTLLANLATLPISTSSGAFVYRLNPMLGTVERATQSFGPLFVERAMATGRYAGSIGVTFQHYRFTSLDGHDLRDGTFVTLANRFVDEGDPFDVDRLTLDVDANVATAYGTLGITDRIDVGVAIPVTVLRVTGARVNVYRDRTFTQAAASATAIGLADMVLRSKVTVLGGRGAALAVAANLRLPTGRKEDLLGTGSRSLSLSGIASVEQGALSAHGRAGWTAGGLTRDLTYAGAVGFSADRVTWTAELLGRATDTIGRIVSVAAPHPDLSGVQTVRLQPQVGGLRHLITLVPGIKWNVADTWVLAASLSLPLTSNGLVSPFAPFAALDYGVQW